MIADGDCLRDSWWEMTDFNFHYGCLKMHLDSQRIQKTLRINHKRRKSRHLTRGQTSCKTVRSKDLKVCRVILWQEVLGGYFPKGNSSSQTEHQRLYWSHGWCERIQSNKRRSFGIHHNSIQTSLQQKEITQIQRFDHSTIIGTQRNWNSINSEYQ